MKKELWIKKNIAMIKTGVKKGFFAPTLLRDYEISKSFNEMSHSKMLKYSILSEKYRISERQIRVIIAEMKKNV